MPVYQDDKTENADDQEWRHPYEGKTPSSDELENQFNADDAQYPLGHPSTKKNTDDIESLENSFNTGATIHPGQSQNSGVSETERLKNLDIFRDDGNRGTSNVKQAIQLFSASSTAKKGLTAGIAGLLLFVGAMGLASFLSVYQLEHFAQTFHKILDARSERILNRRANAHYKIVFDEDGKGLFKKGKTASWLERKYSGVDPEKVVSFMRENGSDIYVNKKGEVVLNGEPIRGKLSDQRSVVNKEFEKVFGEKNGRFMMRDKRFTGLLKSLGIQRTFFENSKRKVDNWQLRTIEKIRQRQLASSSGTLRTDPNQDPENQDENTQRAMNELDIADEVAAEQELLKDPSKVGSVADPSLVDDVLKNADPGAIIKGAVPEASAIAGSLKIDQVGQTACSAKAYTSAVRNGAEILRYAGLMKWGMTVAVAASQQKEGKDVTAEQVSAFMALMNAPLIKPDGERVKQGHDVSNSGAYQMLTGKTDAKPTNTEQFAVDLSKTGGAAGALGKLDNWADGILNTITSFSGINAKTYCRVSSGWLWQLGSAAIGIAVAVFTGGSNLYANVAFSAVKSALFGVLTEFLKPILVRQFAGVIINGWEPGDQKMDAAITGYTIKAQANNKLIGGHRLTKRQVADIESQIAIERREKLQNASIYDRYFALSNVDSTSAKIAANLANTTASGNTAITGTLANIPSSFFNTLAVFNPLSIRAKAAGETTTGNEWLVENPMGIKQYGFTDTELDEFDPEENANFIDTGHKQAYDDWVSFCYPIDDGTKALGLYADDNEEQVYEQKCENNDQLTRRFRIYRLDRQLATSIAFLTGQSECMDPDSEDENCAYQSSTDAQTTTIDTANMAAVDGWAWPAEKIYAGPCYGGPRGHAGLDINVRATNIAAQAAHDGVVTKVSYDGGAAGNYLTVKVSDSLYYSYEHLRSISVREGQDVKVGDQLGVIGKTGNVQNVRYGHLHMVISTNGTLGSYGNLSNTKNPLDYLPKNAPNGYVCTPT